MYGKVLLSSFHSGKIEPCTTSSSRDINWYVSCIFFWQNLVTFSKFFRGRVLPPSTHPTMCPEMRFTVFNHFLRNGLTNFQLEGGFWYLHFKGFKSVFYTWHDILLNYKVSKIILRMVAYRASLQKSKKVALET